jgi:hypothetical protein
VTRRLKGLAVPSVAFGRNQCTRSLALGNDKGQTSVVCPLSIPYRRLRLITVVIAVRGVLRIVAVTEGEWYTIDRNLHIFWTRTSYQGTNNHCCSKTVDRDLHLLRTGGAGAKRDGEDLLDRLAARVGDANADAIRRARAIADIIRRHQRRANDAEVVIIRAAVAGHELVTERALRSNVEGTDDSASRCRRRGR